VIQEEYSPTQSPGSPAQSAANPMSDPPASISPFGPQRTPQKESPQPDRGVFHSTPEDNRNLMTFSPGGASPIEVPDMIVFSPDRVTDAGPPPTTNMVKPTLEDILNLIRFGKGQFMEERNTQMNRLEYVIQRNMSWLSDATSRVKELDPAIENGVQFLPQMIEMWGNQGQYFSQLYQAAADENRPIPDLRLLNHPSSDINQESLKLLLWEAVLMCHQVERQLRLSEIMYSSLDEAVEFFLERFKQTFSNLSYFEDIRTNLKKENQGLLKIFTEKQRLVEDFLAEWTKGGDQLNQPSSPSSPAPSPVAPRTPRTAAAPQANIPAGPGIANQPASPVSSFDTSTQQHRERVKGLQKKTQIVEELVKRYNDLYGTILHEVQNIRDQNVVLEHDCHAKYP